MRVPELYEIVRLYNIINRHPDQLSSVLRLLGPQDIQVRADLIRRAVAKSPSLLNK
jgi:hypothetical protein